jgi:hypothetical protein
MSNVDGRIFAWQMAVRLLDWAGDARQKTVENKNFDQRTDSMPPIYHAVVAEAAVYAELARAATQVGLYGGDWLERKVADEREAEELRMKREAMFEEMAKRKQAPEEEDR